MLLATDPLHMTLHCQIVSISWLHYGGPKWTNQVHTELCSLVSLSKNRYVGTNSIIYVLQQHYHARRNLAHSHRVLTASKVDYNCIPQCLGLRKGVACGFHTNASLSPVVWLALLAGTCLRTWRHCHCGETSCRWQCWSLSAR